MKDQNIFFKICYRILYCLFLFIPFYTYAQSNTGYVKYDFRYPSKKDVKIKKSKLLFNEHESLFVYNKLSMVDSTSSTAVFSAKGFTYIPLKADKKGFLIYRDFDTHEIQFRVPEIVPLDPLSVEDNWVVINWEIKNNYKTIQGYTCQKAKGKFRGRTYKVWFTKEIPLPYGPWKLFGLPGLILEAKDTRGQVKFKLVEVCYPCKIDVKIKKPLEKDHRSIKEYVAYKDYKGESLEVNMQSTLDSMRKKIENFDIQITLDNPTTKKDIKEKRDYQMEIIYEWEDYPGDTPNPYRNETQKGVPVETISESIKIKTQKR